MAFEQQTRTALRILEGIESGTMNTSDSLELVENGPPPLRVRAGLHTGDVLVDGADVVGNVVNVAARVTESAKGGEVLISRELRDALPSDDVPHLSIGRPRMRALKGLDERIAVCAVKRP